MAMKDHLGRTIAADDADVVDEAELPVLLGVFRGAGAPAIAADPGSMYLNTSGGAGTTLYVKESGTDATGWVAK